MKKMLILTLVLLMTMSLTACGGGNENFTGSNDISSATTQTADNDTTSVANTVFDKNWPDNEFTKLLPKPNFELTLEKTGEKSFSVSFTNSTLDNAATEKVKAYAKLLESAGFVFSAEVIEEQVIGMVRYSYSAKNKDDWQVKVHSSVATAGLTITKP